MLFNSIDFAVFLPVVFSLYWFVFRRNLQLQNLFIVVASYVFYGWWDSRFLILMTATIVCSYASGVLIEKYPHRARTTMVSNIVLNLLILGFFKYYNFFVQNFVEAFTLFGKTPEVHTLKIILPVGISFYTFQALSYSIDVYRKKMTATKDYISFFAFVSFFPQLVAGPIERATNLLPQFYSKRTFSYAQAVNGMQQILWGLFKKIVIADNCATTVNIIFDGYNNLPASALLLGALLFTFQIYGDFSGYSDIAIGTARLFGFNLMRNFAFPYFSRDIAEFWRRWHISLTTWFRDYIYIPLGGSRCGKWKIIRNTWIIFLVSGFWHGANWTFIAWGGYHALLFMPLLLLNKNRKYTNVVAQNSCFPSVKEIFAMLITFGLVMVGWIIFRANDIQAAVGYIHNLFSSTLLSPIALGMGTTKQVMMAGIAIPLMLLMEWVNRRHEHGLSKTFKNKPLRWLCYILLVIMIAVMGGIEQAFVYFQF